MAQAKNGDTIKVHYTGRLKDGTVFDSSEGRDPMQFTLGAGKVIPAFEEAVIGMTPGESTNKDIPADQAYGPHREEMVVQVKKEQLPKNIDPKVGQRLQLVQPDERVIPVTVTEVNDSHVTLDANHPLAGKDLQFDIELVEIV
jgi:FKBP-type peptidyl-prolyl cis-trans isomerase 2